jgi:hypothetical protein
MHHELPRPDKAGVPPFLAGALLYAGLIFTTWRF